MYMYSSTCDDVDTSRQTGIDEAVITISSELRVSLWSQSDECWQCPLVNNVNVSVNQSRLLKMDTTFPRHIVVMGDENTTLYDYPGKVLVDQGDYNLNISHDGSCNFVITNSPINNNLPVFVALSAIVVAALLWILVTYLLKCGVLFQFTTQHLINADLGTALVTAEETSVSVSGSQVQTRSRVQSVDTLRGLSLMLMVFVNYRGGRYWYFKHAAWNGLTVADLVFPWFVFVMGTSIAISFHASCGRAVSRSRLFCRILRRTTILFMLGLAISNHDVDVQSVRVFGVLQRLALTYCMVAITELLTPHVSPQQYADKCWRAVRELVVSWPLWLVAVCLLLTHTLLTFLLHVPGCPRGYLGPGGLHADGKYVNCTGGAAGYIDRSILTPSHMYKHGTCKAVYDCTVAYDPEGILGTMTSAILCILGVQAGKILMTYETRSGRSLRWIAWALLTGIIGGCLCGWSKEGGVIPVNKNLWSLSYILVLASMAFVLMTAFYNIVDVYQFWSGAPFTYLGMNSIVIYVCHEVFHDYFPIQFYIADTHAAHLAISIWGTAFWVFVAAYLHHKKIFIAI